MEVTSTGTNRSRNSGTVGHRRHAAKAFSHVALRRIATFTVGVLRLQSRTTSLAESAKDFWTRSSPLSTGSFFLQCWRPKRLSSTSLRDNSGLTQYECSSTKTGMLTWRWSASRPRRLRPTLSSSWKTASRRLRRPSPLWRVLGRMHQMTFWTSWTVWSSDWSTWKRACCNSGQ